MSPLTLIIEIHVNILNSLFQICQYLRSVFGLTTMLQNGPATASSMAEWQLLPCSAGLPKNRVTNFEKLNV